MRGKRRYKGSDLTPSMSQVGEYTVFLQRKNELNKRKKGVKIGKNKRGRNVNSLVAGRREKERRRRKRK